MTKAPNSAIAGFSLLELMVTVAVMSIIMAVAFQLMTSSQVSFDRSKTLVEAKENADFGVARITELIRGAGANPEGKSTINSLNFISNKETDSSTPDPHVVRILSDQDGDGDVISRVESTNPADAKYYVLSSEDVTIKFFPETTTVGDVTIPAHTICMIDNTGGADQGVPVVLVKNIIDFSCPISANPREVTLTMTAGPSDDLPTTDPRYVSFTRTTQIRLRNRN